jgi:lysophospholipase
MSDNKQSSAAGSFAGIPDNPAPAGLEIIWISLDRRRKMRMAFAPSPVGQAAARGTVIICPGRTEFIEKYFEVAHDCLSRGFSAIIFDWPGQGLSDRLHKDRMAGHVTSFSVYVDALRRGLDAIGARAVRPHVILAHSMGGAIALEALRTRKVTAEAAAFSAPMWGLPVWFFQRWAVRAARLFGFGGLYVRRPGPPETFASNPVTHDLGRWERCRRLVDTDDRLRLGEPTIAWLVSSLHVIRGFFEAGALDRLRRLPVLTAIAEEETIVSKSSQRRLARRLKAGRTVEIGGARHEILMETDDRRAAFLEAFDALLERAGI